MKAVVLAGGYGTRLKDRVPDKPKPMAPVAGRPFLEYVLDRLVAGDVHDIILSVGYRANEIIGYFGNAYRNAVLSYAIENEPLGTGGAIINALRGHGDDPVLVVNGDTLLDIDYEDLVRWYSESPASVAMVLKKVPDVARYGAVLVSEGRVTGFTEKGMQGPGLINAGVYVLEPAVFESYGLTGRFGLEADLLQKYCGELRPRAFITDGYFIDIGIPVDYDRAQIELAH